MPTESGHDADAGHPPPRRATLEVYAPAALSPSGVELERALARRIADFTDITPEIHFVGAMTYVGGTAPRRVLERTDFALRKAMAEVRAL